MNFFPNAACRRRQCVHSWSEFDRPLGTARYRSVFRAEAKNACLCEEAIGRRGNPLQVSENPFRTCRGRCPHRPKMKKCAYIHTLEKCFGAGSSGGNFLVPARKLIRSRLNIPRPHHRRHVRIFRVAMGGFIGALTVYTHRLSSRDDEGIVPYEFLGSI